MSSSTWGALVYDIWNYIFSNFLPLTQVTNCSVLNSHFRDLSRIVAKARMRTFTIRQDRIFTRNVPLPPSAGGYKPLTILSVRVNDTAIFSRVCVALVCEGNPNPKRNLGNRQLPCTVVVVSLDSTFRVSMEVQEGVWDVRQAKDGNFLLSGKIHVFVFSATGQFLHELGGPTQLFICPLKIRVDFEDGCIYVADNRRYSISVWTADYKFARTIECKSPVGMGIHKDRLYVASAMSICVFNKHTGALLYRFAVPTVYQLDVDANGNVVTCNAEEGVLFYSAAASGPQGNLHFYISLRVRVYVHARARLVSRCAVRCSCVLQVFFCGNFFNLFLFCIKSSAPRANQPHCTRFQRRGCRWYPTVALSSV